MKQSVKARKASASASRVHHGGNVKLPTLLLPIVMPAGMPSYLRHEHQETLVAAGDRGSYKRDQPRTSPKKMGRVSMDLLMNEP
jgi:hypothetical protein